MSPVALHFDDSARGVASASTLTRRTCAVPANQTSVAFLDGERGEPVVFLHASASSGNQWRKIADTLDVRYRPILIDLYGYGETPQWRHRRPMLLADEARLVHAVLDRLGQSAHIIGHSYGGAVALRAAADRPERVRSLTLIEPVAFHLLRMSPARDGDFLEVYGLAREVGRLVVANRPDDAMRVFIDYWSGKGTWEAMRPERRGALAAAATKVASDFRAAIGEDRMPSEYRRFPFASLIVAGTCSPGPTRSIAGLLAGILPQAAMATIEAAGHMAPLSHGAEVAALIDQHLSSLEPALRRCA